MCMALILVGSNHDRHQTISYKQQHLVWDCLASSFYATDFCQLAKVVHCCSCVTEWFYVISSWTVNVYGTDPHR